ncbi:MULTISPECIES: M48 family metallopeptidase [unclassified Prevotella]|uniref:tetratricopeptide repeat protein n=1 Tax=unclassified Prevotella TaxID=2638335 RepID=UPI00048CF00A|nr:MULTISPECIES: hypothetical protein [unclassified Prevotella]
MKKLLIILMSITIMVGCTERQHPLLKQAWGLVEDKPNKAYTILGKVQSDALTDADRAEYGLLKTIVAYKIHGINIVDNDSLISASIAYYNLHGDEWHRGRAYYYRGMLRMYRYDNMQDAIIDFKMAETIAEHADDKDLKNRVYDILHHVNIISHNRQQSLRYARKWLDNSMALNDSVMMLKNLLICANAYADLDQLDSACVYLDRTLRLEKHADSSLLPSIYATAAIVFQEHGDEEKALSYMKKWEGTSSYENIGFLTLARIRKAQGQYDKAIRLLKVEMDMPDRDQKTRMKCMELLSELYELTGDKELTLETKAQIQAYDDSMKYVNRAMQMDDWQQKFDEVRQTKEFDYRLSWMQSLIIALIVVVTLAIATGLLIHRRKVRRLSNRLDEDAQRLSNHRTKIDELEGRMEHISNTLLVGTQMFNQLQQRQPIAEATAKEQQSLVDYFSQLRPKRWQEWQRKYSGLSTAQYIFLIMQDDLHYDDAAIAAALDVKRTSVRSMRSRIKSRER